MENITTPTPEFNQPESALQTKPKTNYLNIFLIIFAFVLFISGAYYLGRQSSVIPVSNPVAVLPQTTPVPTTTIDPTANWKTYTDKYWKYSVMYPSDWKVITHDKPTINLMPNSMDEFSSGLLTISLSLNQETPLAPSGYDIKISPSLCGNSTFAMKDINNNIFCWAYDRDVTFNPKSDLDQAIYNQILSTFKFTESKAEVTPSLDPKTSLNNVIKNRMVSLNSKYNMKAKDIIVTIGKMNDTSAAGSISFTPEYTATYEVSGGGWIAVKVDGVWKVIAEFQEPPSCSLMNQYNVPESIYGNCNP